MRHKGRGEAAAEVVEFSVDREDYEGFERLSDSRHLDREDALKVVLTEGIGRYWPLQLAYMEKDYAELKESFKEYSRDNEILRKIYAQNNGLRKLLEPAKSAGRGG
ncbi:MAG: hypothetical protein JRM76_04495 [Nitrososphaerota archaeon]|nr:hypothetical protein [Nitrososphaerota archaeon]MCL5671971.1 hypothetical protein [Nitrososphaerota archaeon]MDG6912681.1 hypothetical protein [Nitrososphaerota archaeon]MDG6937013.1 hypothetical protein [Nitrososphaerota archaeon]MDG6969693.1 hypothetical protein [Nitrososphaerota archaeon]